jgi:hypothetical protein
MARSPNKLRSGARASKERSADTSTQTAFHGLDYPADQENRRSTRSRYGNDGRRGDSTLPSGHSAG